MSRIITSDLLNERGKTHGDWQKQSLVAQLIKNALALGPQWGDMSESQKEALQMTATKMSRIVCGNPNHQDSWDDIIGYINLGKHGKNPYAGQNPHDD